MAANLIRSPGQAESQLSEGVQDIISLGRPHIADPHWAKKAESGHAEDIKRCICCLYCIESMQNNAYIGDHGYCAVNPFVGSEKYELKKYGNGRRILVVGSGTAGLTAAELLTVTGNRVTVVEMADEIAPDVWHQHVNDIMPRLEEKKTEFLTSRKLTAIKENSIVIEDKKGNKSEVATDFVVLSLGAKSENALYNELKNTGINTYLIGDAGKVGRIADATASAFGCVKKI